MILSPEGATSWCRPNRIPWGHRGEFKRWCADGLRRRPDLTSMVRNW